MIAAVRHLAGVVAGRVPNPVACDRCRTRRQSISLRDARLLAEHGHLLCPCGGHEFSLPRLPRRRAVQ
ncbi:hypothetical protein [Thermomonospora cellulosilytica]|uniref:Uncharacterized protein n=1 Tax=Thermomonospora cellulosilytica TaxID=1411118 RepID=A0A7W3MXJ6_9ACTN|nr:hypothetical protein [Thermomonospora cellulosilytica]MBA9003774.1 hypothetical protein [Thermomonospora cellulosilytica]